MHSLSIGLSLMLATLLLAAVINYFDRRLKPDASPQEQPQPRRPRP